ncbi:hypothetical protein FPRO04_07522 [Fusarium proliferatum]|nr:hypothetical protein FPRO03_13153 [Fusarium proliferatum]KAG4277225.1 hypothetical protein FPRO04_07522 [Fusarium proliferatum]
MNRMTSGGLLIEGGTDHGAGRVEEGNRVFATIHQHLAPCQAATEAKPTKLTSALTTPTPLSALSLSSIIEDFQKPPEPYWLADIRFGHLVVPSCLSAEESTTREIISAIRGQEIDCPIIFVHSRHKQRICRTEMLDLPLLPQYNETTLEYEWFSSILEKNRAGDGTGN